MLKHSDRIRLVEVGPRDGLQNEALILPLSEKVSLIQDLVRIGLHDIEIGSFVSSQKIPQFADNQRLFQAILNKTWAREINFSALVPNQQGFELALATGLKYIAFFTAVSDSFCQHNIHCSIAESLDRLECFLPKAKAHGIRVRAYISCVMGCPYEGFIPYEKTQKLSETLLDLGCDEISLGDTIGVGSPGKVKTLLNLVLKNLPAQAFAVHFHDTYGQAIANILVALDKDIRVIDSAVGGLGGCPYAPGASGNVATEDVVYLLEGLGLKTGIDLPALAQLGQKISNQLGHPSRSKVGLALLAQGSCP